MKTFSFSKKERLKNRSLISKLFEEGSSFYVYPFRVFVLKLNDLPSAKPQVLISVGKRRIPAAPQRNLVKRRFREAYRLNKHLFINNIDGQTGQYILGFVYTEDHPLDYTQIRDKIILILHRLSKLNETPPK